MLIPRQPLSVVARAGWAATGLMLVLSGCAGRNLDVANPVVGAPPPRRAQALGQSGRTAREPLTGPHDAIQPVAHSDGLSPADLGIEAGEVAATVNGRPILVSDVLDRYSLQLAQARQKLSPARYEKLRGELLEKELPGHIEQQILIDAVFSELDDEQRRAVEQQLDMRFEEHIEQMKKQLGVETITELEAYLQASGTTLSRVRKAFADHQLAMQSMSLHAGGEPSVSRQELMAEYERRIEEYTSPAQVKWQQIWISYARHGGREGALEVLDQAIEELRAGVPFEDVARKYSNGVMTQEGGHWDWTQRESLADEEVARLLGELRVGEIGEVIAGEKAFQLVRVTGRRPVRRKPFAEVQAELSEELTRAKRQQKAEQTLEKLKASAVVTTMFDDRRGEPPN